MSSSAARVTVPSARGTVSWALVELARNPYVSLIFMFVFAPYFAATVVGDAVRGQKLWSQAYTFAGLGVGICAPLLGAVVDRIGARKPWVLASVLIMAVGCWLLWFAYPGAVRGLPLWAIITVVMALMICFECGAVAHNAMLPDLSNAETVGHLSGLGLTLGAVGSLLALVGVLFGIVLPATHEVNWSFLPEHPPFGLDASAFEHARIVGPLCAVWMILFIIPFLLWTPDVAATDVKLSAALRGGWRQLIETLAHLRDVSNIGRFLLARMLYNDGTLGVQAYCAIYAAGVFGWSIGAIMVFALILTACCVLGGMLGGALDASVGSRRAILLTLGCTCLAFLVSLSVTPTQIFFMTYDAAARGPLWAFPYFRTLPEVIYVVTFMVLAVTITALIANSRALLARLAPAPLVSQFFGLYALSGTATAFLGHGIVAVGTGVTGTQRGGIACLVLLLVLGWLLMLRVREDAHGSR